MSFPPHRTTIYLVSHRLTDEADLGFITCLHMVPWLPTAEADHFGISHESTPSWLTEFHTSFYFLFGKDLTLLPTTTMGISLGTLPRLLLLQILTTRKSLIRVPSKPRLLQPSPRRGLLELSPKLPWKH